MRSIKQEPITSVNSFIISYDLRNQTEKIYEYLIEYLILYLEANRDNKEVEISNFINITTEERNQAANGNPKIKKEFIKTNSLSSNNKERHMENLVLESKKIEARIQNYQTIMSNLNETDKITNTYKIQQYKQLINEILSDSSDLNLKETLYKILIEKFMMEHQIADKKAIRHLMKNTKHDDYITAVMPQVNFGILTSVETLAPLMVDDKSCLRNLQLYITGAKYYSNIEFPFILKPDENKKVLQVFFGQLFTKESTLNITNKELEEFYLDLYRISPETYRPAFATYHKLREFWTTNPNLSLTEYQKWVNNNSISSNDSPKSLIKGIISNG